MITPDTFVRDVHAFLTSAGSFNYHTIDINNSFFKESIRLLLPDANANLIDDVH